ncbi:DUF1569 domain-containing protein [Rheinheimera mesophila]|uniref:DUF1569 domain-containing protein n=1 Tax=Rheinheimera mesophila TaxID=1547515 RepID=A0A3P3QIY4_9GAMM|nr:DUF1569 domain-containing protein [Rheinheimera mesophila]RRJ20293.1 DUF1569 domain-containing protein [Rheinheimera mesophila]
MNRRHFLFSLAAVPVIALAGVELASHRFIPEPDVLLTKLNSFKSQQLQSSGSWSPTMVFQHLTQSVMGAVTGYPEQKAAWFTHTVGPLALKVFKAAGAMQHPLDEAIPGMPELDVNLPVETALDQLITALQLFQQSSTLQPHFAYGSLSHSDFMAAHQLHIEQHLTQIEVATLRV